MPCNGDCNQGREACAKVVDATAANSKQYLERLIHIMGTFDLATGHADTFDELLDSLESELRDVLGYYRQQRTEQNFCSRCGKRTADMKLNHAKI